MFADLRVLGSLAMATLLAGVADAQQGGNSYYVAQGGDDGAPGTLAQPWASVAHAVAQLRPGDTLFLRGGTYFERDLRLDLRGDASAPITIRNHPGEVPVIDGGFSEFRAAGNADWEVFDSAKGIYRSVARFPSAGRVYGQFGPGDGGFRLVAYVDMGPLGTDNEDYDDAWPFYYIGPGVHWSASDERIYARLKRGRYQAQMGYAVPRDPDPGQTPMFLFGEDVVLRVMGSSAHVVLEGLTLRYGKNAITLDSGCHDITIRNTDVFGGRYHVLVREGAHDITFDGLTVVDGVPPWVAWTDVKRPTSGRPGHQFQGAGIELDGAVDSVIVRNSRFEHVFDGIDATGMVSNLSITNNVFDSIRDDVVQCGTSGWNVEFAYNVCTDVHAGFSRDGPAPPPVGRAGTKYVHHNIIDCSKPQLIGRADPRGLLGSSKYQGPNGDGMGNGTAFGVHGISPGIDDPWKIYHNTVIAMDDTSNRGVGHTYTPDFGPLTMGVLHEVYNNVFVQTSDIYIARKAVVDGSQFYDGNLYFRAAGGERELFYQLQYSGSSVSFDTLAEFRASPVFSSTANLFPSGWEQSGVEGDPQLDQGYVPSASGPAASGAVDLSSRNWPGLKGEVFRGALAPASAPAANRVPVALDDNASLSGSFVDVAVLDNDSDPDNDPLSITAIAQPAGGSVTLLAGGILRYVVGSTFSGADRFAYTIGDSRGGSASAEVSVSGSLPNLPPVAIDDAGQTSAGAALVLDPLANDTDPENDPLTIIGVSQPLGGAVVVLTGGGLQYVPSAGSSGRDQFGYQISDGRGGSAAATIVVDVSGGNVAPVVGDITVSSRRIRVGQPVTLSVEAEDPDGGIVSYTWGVVRGGGAVFSPNGSSQAASTTAVFDRRDKYQVEVQVTDGETTVTRSIDLRVR